MMQPHKDQNQRRESINKYAFVYLGLAVLSSLLIYAASEYYQTARLSQLVSFQAGDTPGPIRGNLYPKPFGNHFFGDFLIIFRLSQQSSPYFSPNILPFSYFPLAAVLIGPLVLLSYWFAFAIFVLVGVGGFLLACWSGLSKIEPAQRRNILALTVFSGPMFSVIDRGNLQIFLMIFCVAAVFALSRGKNFLSAIFIGIAAGIKGYPILFLLLFVKRREWGPLFAGVSTFALGIIIPMSLYERGFSANLRELISQFIGSSNPQHAVGIRGYNSSLLSLLDTCRTSVIPHFSTFIQFLEDHYTIVGAVFMLILLLHSVSKHSSNFESLLLITVVICLVPQTVGYYVLLLYFVPLLFLWVDSDSETSKNGSILIAIAVIMVPKGFPLWFPLGNWSPASATYTSLLNPACGLIISFVCIKNISGRRLAARLTKTNSKGTH